MAKSNVAVRYFSKSGNTKKLADVIAKTVGCKAEQIPSPIEDKVDILFLGDSVYWGGISSAVKNYIQALDKDKIGKVVVFSTSALAERAFPQMQKKLQEKSIRVERENFYCRGGVYCAPLRTTESVRPGQCSEIYSENGRRKVLI